MFCYLTPYQCNHFGSILLYIWASELNLSLFINSNVLKMFRSRAKWSMMVCKGLLSMDLELKSSRGYKVFFQSFKPTISPFI